MKGRDRDSFSSGGYWSRPDNSGRAPNLRTARDRATFDHQPQQSVLGRLATKLLGGRR